MAKMDDCLKKAAEGRKMSITLSSLEYSGDLSKQLLAFSEKLEKVYKNLQDLRGRKVSDESAYQKFFQVMDEKLAWYTKAEAGFCFTITKQIHWIAGWFC